jgi:hypothetical protein
MAEGSTMSAARWVYGFGGGSADGDASMKNLLGGKGANLAEMSALGLPVPPGFTITTECCTHFYANGRIYPQDLKAQVAAGLARVADRQDVRRSREPAARLGAFGRAGLDAGHDGYGAEPRPERQDGRRPG